MTSTFVRVLLGRRPRALLCLLVPTGLAVAMDALLRGGTLLGYAPQGKLIYASSLLISAAFWALPLWGAAQLATRAGGSVGRGRVAAACALGGVVLCWLLPFATMGYGGQALYHRVFHSYMGRDTLRLGIALRGTVTDWFVAWGTTALLGGVLVAGAVVTAAFVASALRALAPHVTGAAPPALLALTFPASLACLWFDLLDSRFLQAATPDTCFAHGVVHAARMRLAGEAWVRKGMSLRAPAPLPPLPRPAHAPNVLVILLESVRADALCSEPPPRCDAPFLDAVAASRVPLGLLTSQTPNTFSSFLVLTTGLAPDVDFASAHAAPVLWELAKAAGYRTAYVSAQNPKYEDFGTFVQRAGIDTLVTGTELGGMEQEQIGAPDERATAALLDFVKNGPGSVPYFAVLHLSNTHAPYRVDPGLLPFTPSAASGLGDIESFHNRYRNSVRMEERTVASLLAQIEALPGWDDTAVVVLADHGEQFREHGGLYHNHSLYDEELRVPGFLVAGKAALSDPQRLALASYAGARAYTQDVHATLTDLLGVYDARATLPDARLVGGRSLLRGRVAGEEAEEPAALLATSTAVWEPDDARYGVMRGDRVVVSSADRAWVCFDTRADPEERRPLPPGACAGLEALARGAFSGADVPP